MVTVEFWETKKGFINTKCAVLRPDYPKGRSTYHEGQHKAADVVSDLGGNVVAKLLQCSQKALQLAQLASPTGGRQLLVRQ